VGFTENGPTLPATDIVLWVGGGYENCDVN